MCIRDRAYDIPETYVAELNLSAIEAALQPAAAFVEILSLIHI